jgi:hypothetical protein
VVTFGVFYPIWGRARAPKSTEVGDQNVALHSRFALLSAALPKPHALGQV